MFDEWAGSDVAVISLNEDHPPRHIHIEKENGELIGRLDLERMRGMEGWQPDRKLLKIIEALKNKGRL